LVLEIPPEEVASSLPFPSNASYSEVFYENGEFKGGRYSVDEYLSGVGVTTYNG
jgi:hypothetical protein